MKHWKRGLAAALALLACLSCLTGCGQETADSGLSLMVCVGETPATYNPIYAAEPGSRPS